MLEMPYVRVLQCVSHQPSVASEHLKCAAEELHFNFFFPVLLFIGPLTLPTHISGQCTVPDFQSNVGTCSHSLVSISDLSEQSTYRKEAVRDSLWIVHGT